LPWEPTYNHGIDANELSEKVRFARTIYHRLTLTGQVTPSVKLKAGEEVSVL
jgi:hypothetical protein